MDFCKFVEGLKQKLLERKYKWIDRNSWNGDTEGGFYATEEVDMEKLFAEIDEFSKTFQKEDQAKP